MPHSPISAGTQVTYQGEPYTVRAVDGSVLELAYHTGAFFRLVHASSVKVCLPPATSTAASLPAPAAAQGAGTLSQLAQVEAGACECADEEALRNLRWLARCNEFFAHLSQHRQGLNLLSAACIPHDSADAAHEEVQIERIQAWARATGADAIARFFDQVGQKELSLLIVHGSSMQRGEA